MPNELKHYGIPGMKWGVRNDKRKTSSGSKDYQKTQKLLRKGAKNLSTEELKAVVSRLNLERQVNSASPTTIAKGKNLVKGVLAAAGTASAIYGITQTPLAKAIGSAISAKMNLPTPAKKLFR